MPRARPCRAPCGRRHPRLRRLSSRRSNGFSSVHSTAYGGPSSSVLYSVPSTKKRTGPSVAPAGCSICATMRTVPTPPVRPRGDVMRTDRSAFARTRGAVARLARAGSRIPRAAIQRRKRRMCRSRSGQHATSRQRFVRANVALGIDRKRASNSRRLPPSCPRPPGAFHECCARRQSAARRTRHARCRPCRARELPSRARFALGRRRPPRRAGRCASRRSNGRTRHRESSGGDIRRRPLCGAPASASERSCNSAADEVTGSCDSIVAPTLGSIRGRTGIAAAHGSSTPTRTSRRR